MQDCSCPLNNPFYMFNKLTKESKHASNQAKFYYSPMEHPPTLFPSFLCSFWLHENIKTVTR